MIFNPKDALQNIEPNDNGTGADALINGDIELSDKELEQAEKL